MTYKQAIDQIIKLQGCDLEHVPDIARRAVGNKAGRTVVIRRPAICAFVAKKVYGIKDNVQLAGLFYPSDEAGAADPAESLRKAVGELKKLLHSFAIPDDVFSPGLQDWKLSLPSVSKAK